MDFELSEGQIEQLAEFTSNLSLVFIASVVAPIFSGVDTLDPVLVILGVVAAMFSLASSLLLKR